jgi:hypothetical protein
MTIWFTAAPLFVITAQQGLGGVGCYAGSVTYVEATTPNVLRITSS